MCFYRSPISAFVQKALSLESSFGAVPPGMGSGHGDYHSGDVHSQVTSGMRGSMPVMRQLHCGGLWDGRTIVSLCDTCICNIAAMLECGLFDPSRKIYFPLCDVRQVSFVTNLLHDIYSFCSIRKHNKAHINLNNNAYHQCGMFVTHLFKLCSSISYNSGNIFSKYHNICWMTNEFIIT